MFPKKFKIYLIKNSVNNKKYVGVTIQKLKKRLRQHSTVDPSSFLYKEIKKYGIDKFSIEVLFYASSLEDMIDLENYFIMNYDTLHPNGFNKREGGKYGKFTDEVKERMSELLKSRWKNQKHLMNKSLISIKKYTENKKEPVIGINIKNGYVLRFDSIYKALQRGFYLFNNLERKSMYSKNYIWFYDEGFSDQFYIDLAEFQLGGFGKYTRNRDNWKKCDREKRIENFKIAHEHEKKPIIGINRHDLSILEFDSISSCLKSGYAWGNIRQCLSGENKHAYNYCWFYKTHNNIEEYIKESKDRLKNMYKPDDIRPIEAYNDKENYKFNNLNEVSLKGFNKKEVRRVLKGQRNNHKGFKFKFI